MLRRYILFLKKHPLITAAIGIVYVMVCLKSIKAESNFQGFLLRTLMTGAAMFFLYQVSGDKTLTASYNDTWYVIKVGIGFLIMAMPIGALGFLNSAEAPLWDNVPLQILTGFLLMMSVGLFEEMSFRALINDAIIYHFRDKKYVFVLSALVSSLVFGAAHVVGFEFTNWLAIAQGIGKTLQAGVFGLSLLFLYWKTRNIWACGVVHGLYDFILSLSSFVYNSPSTASYVMTDERAMTAICVYAVFTLLNLFIFFLIYKKIGKKIDYQKIREEW